MIPFSQKWLSHFWAMYGVKPKWMQMSYFSSIFLVVWWFVVFYILCLLWKMMQIYIMMMQIIYNNVITCIFWCKLLGLFKHWYMSCDYTAFVIRPYDKCRIIAWQMSRNRSNCFLASLSSNETNFLTFFILLLTYFTIFTEQKRVHCNKQCTLFYYLNSLSRKYYLMNSSSRYFGKVQSSSATRSSSLSIW